MQMGPRLHPNFGRYSNKQIHRAVHGNDISMTRARPKLGEEFRHSVTLFGRIALAGCGKSFAHHLHTIVAALSRFRRLLAPGLIERTGIDRIETGVVHKFHNDLLRLDVVTRDGYGQTI